MRVPDVVEQVAGVRLVRPEDWELLCRRNEDAPLWARLWPSALVLAEALRGEDLRGRRVIELGAGLALPSAVAAAAGADVLATDGRDEALPYARRNAGRAQRLTFGAPLPPGPWDLVLAADVLHTARNIDPLLTTLPADVEVLLADPARRSLEAFLARAAERWQVVRSAPDGERGVVLARLVPRDRAQGAGTRDGGA